VARSIYTPIPLGTNPLKRLGATIGSRSPLTPEQQVLYELFIRDARERMSGVSDFISTWLEVMREPLPRVAAAEVAGRVKTLNTLADKLERTPAEKLPSIHDVAGLRVVADMTIFEQRQAVMQLQRLLDDLVDTSRPSLLVDRIGSPSHGYRAMHLIAWPHGRPVEIQIRTEWQHAWAQLMEVVGDRWGRGPRYGRPVEGATQVQRARREQAIGLLMEFSSLIGAYEERSAHVARVHRQDRIAA